MMKIKVHLNKNHDPKVFDTVEDFDKFYQINKEEIDKTSTISLNEMYLIKNHRIGKQKNQVMIYPLKHLSKHLAPSFEITNPTPTDDVNYDKLTDIENKLNQVISFLSVKFGKKIV